VAVVLVALRRAGSERDDVPEILADCHERMRRLEAQLHRLRPAGDGRT
jgi:hypothetical protein